MLAVLVFLLECPKAAFFTLEYSGESRRDLAKMEILTQEVSVEAWDSAFITSFQVILMLPVIGSP